MKHVIFGFIVSLFAVYGQAQGIDTNIHLEDGTIVDCSHIFLDGETPTFHANDVQSKDVYCRIA